MKITDQNFLITGANRGIGLGVARMAAIEGARLHLVSRQPMDNLESFLIKSGAKEIKFYTADLSTREGIDKLIQQLAEVKIDILFNNAGLLTGGLIEEQPLDDIYSMFQVNVNALVHLTRALIPGMVQRKKGKIINNASVSAFLRLCIFRVPALMRLQKRL